MHQFILYFLFPKNISNSRLLNYFLIVFRLFTTIIHKIFIFYIHLNIHLIMFFNFSSLFLKILFKVTILTIYFTQKHTRLSYLLKY